MKKFDLKKAINELVDKHNANITKEFKEELAKWIIAEQYCYLSTTALQNLCVPKLVKKSKFFKLINEIKAEIEQDIATE